ncbi:MAG: hypothetical protein JST40_05885 [Armatimonadetes bacterium]|nr:hypothetical protein [Armatimonadota bacterium]
MATVADPKFHSTRLEAEGRDRIAPAHNALVAWGMANCFLLMAQQYLTFIMTPLGAQKFTFASIMVWVGVALWTNKAPLRVPVGLAFMLILSAWFSFTTMYNQVTIARTTVFNGMDLLLSVYALAFFQGSMLVWIAPHSRRIMGISTLVVGIASCLLAILQFEGVGPALAIYKRIRDADMIQQVVEGEIIRAPGLHSNIGNVIAYGLMGALMLAAISKYRALKWYEFAGICLFLLSTLLVQVRNQLPVVGLISIWLAVILLRRYRLAGGVVGAVMLAAVIVFFLARQDQFGYILNAGASTLEYRQTVLWPQGFHILSQRPLVGIGVEPAFVGWTTQIFPNKWMAVGLMDNGWLVAGIFGGYPAIALLGLTVFCFLLASIRSSNEPAEDYWQLAFRYGMVAVSVFFATGMFFGTLWGNPNSVNLFFILAGLSLNTNPDYRKDLPGLAGQVVNPGWWRQKARRILVGDIEPKTL